MEIYLDTADVAKIEKYCEAYPLAGFTCNPTLVAASDRTIEDLMKLAIGKNVFVQSIALDYEGIIADAKRLKEIRADAYIKIPCTPEGYKAMHILKQQGYKVLATAIYTVGQALMAAACNVDYVAPYVNRMSDTEVDGCELVEHIICAFASQRVTTKIVAASFKNLNQVVRLLVSGVDAVTVPTDIFEKLIDNKLTNDAVDVFMSQWEHRFNKKTL